MHVRGVLRSVTHAADGPELATHSGDNFESQLPLIK